MTEKEEEQLMRLLAELRATDDPLSPSVRALAENIPSIQRLDAEYAELVESVAAVRDGEDALTYRLGDVVISVEIGDDGLVVDIVGGDPSTVECETATAEREALAQEASLWRLGELRSGSRRVVVSFADGRVLATAWFTVPPSG